MGNKREKKLFMSLLIASFCTSIKLLLIKDYTKLQLVTTSHKLQCFVVLSVKSSYSGASS